MLRNTTTPTDVETRKSPTFSSARSAFFNTVNHVNDNWEEVARLNVLLKNRAESKSSPLTTTPTSPSLSMMVK